MQARSSAHRRLSALALASGGFVPRNGVIRGPGTGTSDSIPARMPRGSFVMPADSTETLADVDVSNGEAAIAPEMVNRIGAAALLAMRDTTHEPVRPRPRETRRKSARQQLVDGGFADKKVNSFGDAAAAMRDPTIRQVQATPAASNPSAAAPLPASTAPVAMSVAPANSAASAPIGASPQDVRRNSFGDAAAARIDSNVAQIPAASYGQQMSKVGGAIVDGLAEAAKAVTSYPTSADGKGYGLSRSAISEMALPPSATGIGPGDSTAGAGRGTAADPRSLAPAGWTPASALQQVGPGAQPGAADAKGPPAPNPNDIRRVGNSYSGGPNITADGLTINGRESRGTFSVLSGAPSQPGIGSGGPPPQAPSGAHGQGFQQAPGTDAQSRLDMRNARVGLNSWKPEDRERARSEVAQLSAMQQQGARNAGASDVAGIHANAARDTEASRANVQAAGQAITRQDNQARQQLAQNKFQTDSTAAGLDARSKMNTVAAQEAYLNAKTEGERAAEAAKLLTLSGQPPAQKYTVVRGERYSDGSSAADQVVSNTGQWLQSPSKATQPPSGALDALKRNPKLAASFDAKYGVGASARYLGEK